MLTGLMVSQIWHQLASTVGGGFRKGTMASAGLDARYFAFSCMPLVPFKLLPQCWSSAAVSLSKSVCGFFKRNCLGLQQFLPLTQSPLVFAARSCGDLSSWHWNPGLAGLVCGWDSSLARYPSQIFIHHTCVLDQPILHLHPFYQSGWMWFR